MGVYLRGNAITLVQRFFVVDPLSGQSVLADPGTVTFVVRAPDDVEATYVFGTDVEVTNPQVGVYLCALAPPLPPGDYAYRCEGTTPVVAAGEGTFTILQSGVLAPIDPGVAEYGPCSPWISGDDVANCVQTDVGSDTYLLDSAASMGSQLIYELSGRQFPGICERTVRPCRQGCGCFGQSVAAGLGPWSWTSSPWGGGYGGWYWSSECGDRCGCGSESYVRLPGYPVRRIVQVKLDGDVLSPTDDYRLDERRFLIRLPEVGPPVINRAWPLCQNLGLPDTEPGTYSVTYEWGAEPPELGKQAAAQLAGELYKACPGSSGDCRLPTKVTKIVRQGITMERLVPLADMLKEGATGLPLVDAFLAMANPNGMRRRPAVVQLDRGPFPRSVGQ